MRIRRRRTAAFAGYPVGPGWCSGDPHIPVSFCKTVAPGWAMPRGAPSHWGEHGNALRRFSCLLPMPWITGRCRMARQFTKKPQVAVVVMTKGVRLVREGLWLGEGEPHAP